MWTAECAYLHLVRLLSTVAVPIYTFSSRVWKFPLFHILSNTWYYEALSFCQSDGYERETCSFNLQLHKDKQILIDVRLLGSFVQQGFQRSHPMHLLAPFQGGNNRGHIQVHWAQLPAASHPPKHAWTLLGLTVARFSHLKETVATASQGLRVFRNKYAWSTQNRACHNQCVHLYLF